MKKTYECEYCGKVYNNEEDCVKCEQTCSEAINSQNKKINEYKGKIAELVNRRISIRSQIEELKEQLKEINNEMSVLRENIYKDFPNSNISIKQDGDKVDVYIGPMKENPNTYFDVKGMQNYIKDIFADLWK